VDDVYTTRHKATRMRAGAGAAREMRRCGSATVARTLMDPNYRNSAAGIDAEVRCRPDLAVRLKSSIGMRVDCNLKLGFDTGGWIMM